MITLSAEEKQKFIDWLEQEIKTDKLLLEQMEKLRDGGIAKHRRIEISAQMIVHRKLSSMQPESI